ncbi:Uncharacterised protein [Dermatophilus congolensis]|uniref:Uncharacterized protein n=1 Tax=Dermatophilus congolensis TaxID=1863 RepID=A0AA46BLK9_9MICO|nr:hypothetical protein [Dermatophilus congolensis]STD04747.1 Uncharacterised protein [Dermatophilus congolensis]
MNTPDDSTVPLLNSPVTSRAARSRKVPWLIRRANLPNPQLNDPRTETQALREAISDIWRRIWAVAFGSLLIVSPLTVLPYLLRSPGSAENALATWWDTEFQGNAFEGLEPSAVASGFAAIVVTLFVAHTMQGQVPPSPSENDMNTHIEAKARVIVLDILVSYVGATGAAFSWLLIQLPEDGKKAQSADFLIPLGSVLICSALTALTSRSTESLHLLKLMDKLQKANLNSAVQAYEKHIHNAERRGVIIDKTGLSIRESLKSWSHGFPISPTIYVALGWILFNLVLGVVRGGFSLALIAVIIVLATIGCLLGLALLSIIIDGIVTQTIGGRLGIFTTRLFFISILFLIYLLTGIILFFLHPPVGLLMTTFALLPLGGTWLSIPHPKFTESIGVALKRRGILFANMKPGRI